MNARKNPSPLGPCPIHELADRKTNSERVSLRISGAQARINEQKREFVVYAVVVTNCCRSWTVHRRYSDFVMLHQELSRDFTLPELPPKRIFGSSTEKTFVNDRRKGLQEYLLKVPLLPDVCENAHLNNFLERDSSVDYTLMEQQLKTLTQKVQALESTVSRVKFMISTNLRDKEFDRLKRTVSTLKRRVSDLEDSGGHELPPRVKHVRRQRGERRMDMPYYSLPAPIVRSDRNRTQSTSFSRALPPTFLQDSSSSGERNGGSDAEGEIVNNARNNFQSKKVRSLSESATDLHFHDDDATKRKRKFGMFRRKFKTDRVHSSSRRRQPERNEILPKVTSPEQPAKRRKSIADKNESLQYSPLPRPSSMKYQTWPRSQSMSDGTSDDIKKKARSATRFYTMKPKSTRQRAQNTRSSRIVSELNPRKFLQTLHEHQKEEFDTDNMSVFTEDKLPQFEPPHENHQSKHDSKPERRKSKLPILLAKKKSSPRTPKSRKSPKYSPLVRSNSKKFSSLTLGESQQRSRRSKETASATISTTKSSSERKLSGNDAEQSFIQYLTADSSQSLETSAKVALSSKPLSPPSQHTGTTEDAPKRLSEHEGEEPPSLELPSSRTSIDNPQAAAGRSLASSGPVAQPLPQTGVRQLHQSGIPGIPPGTRSYLKPLVQPKPRSPPIGPPDSPATQSAPAPVEPKSINQSKTNIEIESEILSQLESVPDIDQDASFEIKHEESRSGTVPTKPSFLSPTPSEYSSGSEMSQSEMVQYQSLQRRFFTSPPLTPASEGYRQQQQPQFQLQKHELQQHRQQHQQRGQFQQWPSPQLQNKSPLRLSSSTLMQGQFQPFSPPLPPQYFDGRFANYEDSVPRHGAHNLVSPASLQHSSQHQQQRPSRQFSPAPSETSSTASFDSFNSFSHELVATRTMSPSPVEHQQDEFEEFLNNTEVSIAVSQIIKHLQPTPDSELLRKDILNFVSGLVHKAISAQVFPHGSFALKTYLPDGDIDLSAFFSHGHSNSWAQRIIQVLCHEATETEQTNPNFRVQNTTFVNADARIVKAEIGRISVDISANQTDALATLSLFEAIDRMIGQDHLFKQTIILTKAWMKYEACILESSRYLLSSYSMRVLVLYIFNAYHSELKSPLHALMKLLHYLSIFNWDIHAVGLFGPVRLSSLPEMKFDIIREGPTAWPTNVEPLVSPTFLAQYSDFYSNPNKPHQDVSGRPRVFPVRNINVIGPIDPFNNLGRSVSRKNAPRVRFAFIDSFQKLMNAVSTWSMGGQRDGQILINGLFQNSLTKFRKAYNNRVRSSHESDPSEQKGDIMKGNLTQMAENLESAKQFEIPDISEEELVDLMTSILAEGGGVPVGKMGSLLHSHTNNHSLPTMLKERYGGLKKFIQNHSDVFVIGTDHPYNPTVYLRTSKHGSVVSRSPSAHSHSSTHSQSSHHSHQSGSTTGGSDRNYRGSRSPNYNSRYNPQQQQQQQQHSRNGQSIESSPQTSYSNHLYSGPAHSNKERGLSSSYHKSGSSKSQRKRRSHKQNNADFSLSQSSRASDYPQIPGRRIPK